MRLNADFDPRVVLRCEDMAFVPAHAHRSTPHTSRFANGHGLHHVSAETRHSVGQRVRSVDVLRTTSLHRDAMPARTLLIVCLLLCWSLLTACKAVAETGAEGSGAAAASQVESTPSAVEPPPQDSSLDVAAYVAAGVPSPDRDWAGSDMERAAEALTAIVAADPDALPQHGSARSGQLFDRIVSAGDLGIVQNEQLSVHQRLGQAITLQEAQRRILMLYLRALEQRQTSGRNLIELVGASLRTSAVIFTLAEAFMATFSPDDPSYAARQSGMDQMRSGFATSLSGALDTLTEAENFSLVDRQRLAEILESVMPDLIGSLTPASRQELVVRLQAMSGEPSLQDLQPRLSSLATIAAAAQ
jgi:hypothetical protein